MAYVTESRRAAARENGKLGGRPKGSTWSARVEREKRFARKRGERAACAAVDFFYDVMRGLVGGLGPEHRIAAARELMDRFGFPRLAQQQHFGEFPAKLFDLSVPDKLNGSGVAEHRIGNGDASNAASDVSNGIGDDSSGGTQAH